MKLAVSTVKQIKASVESEEYMDVQQYITDVVEPKLREAVSKDYVCIDKPSYSSYVIKALKGAGWNAYLNRYDGLIIKSKKEKININPFSWIEKINHPGYFTFFGIGSLLSLGLFIPMIFVVFSTPTPLAVCLLVAHVIMGVGNFIACMLSGV